MASRRLTLLMHVDPTAPSTTPNASSSVAASAPPSTSYTGPQGRGEQQRVLLALAAIAVAVVVFVALLVTGAFTGARQNSTGTAGEALTY